MHALPEMPLACGRSSAALASRPFTNCDVLHDAVLAVQAMLGRAYCLSVCLWWLSVLHVVAGRKYNDPDAMAMAAESFMNLSPWDYYLPVGIANGAACSSHASLLAAGLKLTRMYEARELH